MMERQDNSQKTTTNNEPQNTRQKTKAYATRIQLSEKLICGNIASYTLNVTQQVGDNIY